MISTNQFKIGMTIELDDTLFNILDFQHVKPGKGGAFVRTKLKNLKTGAVIKKTFRAGEKVELAHLSHCPMQYLYQDGHNYYFMDSKTYEQLALSKEEISQQALYLNEGVMVEISLHENKPVAVELPPFVKLKVTETTPGVRGDTATGGTKPATLETGMVVQVPLFVQEGDVVKIDTRSGKYITRL